MSMTAPRAWLLASRPATLSAAFVPVAVGVAVAYVLGGLRIGPALGALFGAMAIQIGTNFANDVFDFKKGADNEDRLGPVRAVGAGLISPRAMLIGMCCAFSVAAILGVYLTMEAGPTVVVIGIASIVSGIAYTAGPWPLAYLGLGDLFVFVFFGLVAVCGTAFVQMGYVPALAWWASVPVGALSTAILVVNNLRDRNTDAKANKRTLAVRFGRRFTELEYFVLMLLTYLSPVALFFVSGRRSWWIFLPLVTLPYAARLCGQVRRNDGPELNQTLISTAKLLLVFGLSWIAALVLARA